LADAARKQQVAHSSGVIVRERLRSLDDSDLVRAYVAGEERAFAELIERYQTRLLSFVYRMIGDRERSEDLVQEAFIRVYRHAHHFDHSKKFSTWIFVIASNLAKNELRRGARRPILLPIVTRGWQNQGTPELEDPRFRPDELFHERRLQALVEVSIERLPPHQRQVFILRELEGKSYEEIADIVGCCLGTVKSRINRARRFLSTIMLPALR